MRRMVRWLALVLFLFVLSSSGGEAEQFYALSGGRILGCGPDDTLTVNAECTSYQTGLVVGPAVPIETWVAAQVRGAVSDAQTHNQRPSARSTS